MASKIKGSPPCGLEQGCSTGVLKEKVGKKSSYNPKFLKQILRGRQPQSNNAISAGFCVAKATKSTCYLCRKCGFVENSYKFQTTLVLIH